MKRVIILGKLKSRLISFMSGRYGYDTLSYAMLILYALMIVINAFAGTVTLSLLSLVLPVLMFWRIFSRNIYKRRAENERFLKLWRPVASFFRLQRDRLRDIKTNRYRKCPDCKAVLRLPLKKGGHTVVCPKCRKRFEVKIRF